MMDKKKIERALRSALPDAFYWNWSALSEALADQAIVIECEVEHSTEPIELGDFTTIGFPDGIFRRAVNLGGHLGTPGKAIAIILPLEEE